MREYAIEYTHDEMGDMTFRTSKWAHDEKGAVRLMLQKNPDKGGKCIFKRGGTGRIVSVKDITGGARSSTLVKDCEATRSPEDGGSIPPTSTN